MPDMHKLYKKTIWMYSNTNSHSHSLRNIH